ncbi:hypothetical protein P9112_000288 [Eukaryota sp. TZLM1-RC]
MYHYIIISLLFILISTAYAESAVFVPYEMAYKMASVSFKPFQLGLPDEEYKFWLGRSSFSYNSLSINQFTPFMIYKVDSLFIETSFSMKISGIQQFKSLLLSQKTEFEIAISNVSVSAFVNISNGIINISHIESAINNIEVSFQRKGMTNFIIQKLLGVIKARIVRELESSVGEINGIHVDDLPEVTLMGLVLKVSAINITKQGICFALNDGALEQVIWTSWLCQGEIARFIIDETMINNILNAMVPARLSLPPIISTLLSSVYSRGLVNQEGKLSFLSPPQIYLRRNYMSLYVHFSLLGMNETLHSDVMFLYDGRGVTPVVRKLETSLEKSKNFIIFELLNWFWHQKIVTYLKNAIRSSSFDFMSGEIEFLAVKEDLLVIGIGVQ